MGHDIYGLNKAREEIAYARFNMWNDNATILYRLLDALEFYAGVSGNGRSSMFSKLQIEKSMKAFKQLYKDDISSLSDPNFLAGDLKQIFNFIQNCLATAQKEGSVEVYFG